MKTEAGSLGPVEEPPDGLRTVLGVARGSEEVRPLGVRPAQLAEYLGCTERAVEPLLGETVGEYYLKGRVFPIYDWRLVFKLADHPRIVESRRRRAGRMTPKKRRNLLIDLIASWTIADANLEGVVIAGYKSIQECQIPLGGCSVLIGPNGAGKTNLLEAIALARNADAVYQRLRSSPGDVDNKPVMGVVFDLGQQSEGSLNRFLDQFLTGMPDLSIREPLRSILQRPTVLVWTSDESPQLIWDLRRKALDPALASALAGTDETDPWLSQIRNSIEILDPPFHRLASLPAHRSLSALPFPEIQDLHGVPETVVDELSLGIGPLSDRLVLAGVIEGTAAEDPQEGNPKYEALLRTLETEAGTDVTTPTVSFGLEVPWLRWLEADPTSEPEDLVAACQADAAELSLIGPSGHADWIVAGGGEIEITNVLVAARCRDKRDVTRLLRAVLRDTITLPDRLEGASPAELRRTVEEVFSIGEALGMSTARSPLSHDSSGWLEATPYGAVLRPEVLKSLELVATRANALAPSFVRDQGRITLNALSPTDWLDAGRRLSIGLLTRATVFVKLSDAGQGAQRWIAATIREAIRQLTIDSQHPMDRISAEDEKLDEPLPVRLLLVDEPEVSLHPEAQDQVAEWVSAVADPSQRVLVATHSPSMLELPPGSATILRASLSGEQTAVVPIEVDALKGLDEVARELGLGRSGLLLAARGFLVLEGPSDVDVVKACIGERLAEQRIVPIPLHGTGRFKALVQPEFLRAVGKPIAVMFDDVRTSFLRSDQEPQTQEERIMLVIRDQLDPPEQVKLVSYEAPDIICGLPEPAVRRLYSGFTDWDSLVEQWKASSEFREKTNFKTFALRVLGRKPHQARQFIAEVLEETREGDSFPRTIVRASKQVLAWAESQADGHRLSMG